MLNAPRWPACCSPVARRFGFTVAEMLVVVLVLAVLALSVMPALGVSGKRLEVAAQEVGNGLRLALHESRRTGGYVLVDAGTTPGHVLILNSDANAVRGTDIMDPLTKRAVDIDITGSSFSTGVTVNPKFIGPSGTHSQLLIGPGPTFWAAQASSVMGALQPGSGIDLVLGARSVTVAFDSVSGRVVLP